MKALLLIDIQNDFLPGGSLPVAEGDQVVAVANRRMSEFQLVVASQDWHPADHQSFASQHPGKHVGDSIVLDGLQQVLWPDHCVQGSHGAKFPALLQADRIQHVVRKGTDRQVDSYSAFFDNERRRATGLEQTLREHDVDALHVIGLATDYCVRFTVLDALELGFRVVVERAGVRGVERTPGDCQRALDEMQAAGATIL